jgi:large subunit ribosomal protein L5
MTRLEALYKSEVVPALMKEFKYGNRMQVPRLEKVVISMGIGEASKEKKFLEGGLKDLTLIAGQKPLVCKATKSISNFKLREGMEVGAKVTLRRARMYEFLDRLISLAVPRVRDFRGLSPKSFDGRGNYSMGLSEQTVFPEINLDDIVGTQGMNIAVVTTARTDDEARYMLKSFGVPFRD